MSLPDVLRPDDDRAEVRRSLRAWLAFQRGLALHPRRALDLLRRYADPLTALRADARAPASSAGDLDRAVVALRRCGAVAVPFPSPAYPAQLAAHADAAPLLLVRGSLDALAARSVAIVGSRAATDYGRSVSRDLAYAFARAGLGVVSGLAFGIDAAAHRGALDAGGRTVAIQACGPEQVYPAAHRGLAREIVDDGAIVAELPPGTPPRAAHFPLRNRLISALACAVVVVEARERSGSLITVSHALDQGIDVFAVPGPVTSPASAGPNRLLLEGAHVCTSADDVLRVVDPDALALRGESRDLARDGNPIVSMLRDEPLSVDELARRMAREPNALALELLDLELDGRITRDRDGRMRAASPARGRGL